MQKHEESSFEVIIEYALAVLWSIRKLTPMKAWNSN